MADRSVLFVDGNNWYHSLRNAGVSQLMQLDYVKISTKLVGPARSWEATRYYIGKVPQVGNQQLYADQRRFEAQLRNADRRISFHYGRLEPRAGDDDCAKDLLAYLGNLTARIDQRTYANLVRIGRIHRKPTVMVEKAVDVMIAVDMVIMAERNEFDTAYLLSADGDFTPAVDAVRAHGKKVFAVSAGYGAQLAAAVSSFIRIDEPWFADCR